MIYRFGEISVDADRRELVDAGQPVAVQPQVFELLVFLIENRDRVVTKDEIIDRVWQGRIVSDGTLNARINAVRKSVGDSGEKQALVRTFPRRGFRFVADVSDGDTLAIPAVKTPQPAAAPAARRLQPSIAVLPFRNLSTDPEQTFLADGISEDLITDLSKISALFVVARHSSFSFKNTSRDISEIAAALGVDNLLTGSIRRMGPNVRISAQLVDAASGGQIWAERYDSEMASLFSVQDEIVAKIVSALAATLDERRPIIRRTASIDAYERHLRGRSKFWFTPDSCAECIGLQEQAIALDPTYSDAWAALAPPYQSAWSFNWPGYDDGLNIARTKAETAVRLAPESSFALGKLAWVLTFLRDHEASIGRFEEALAIEPNNSDALTFLAEALNFAGEPQRAIEVGKAALQFDPIAAPNCIFHIGHSYFLIGELEHARRQIQQAIERAPAFPVPRLIMAATLAELGAITEARQQIDALLHTHPDHSIGAVDSRYPYASDDQRRRVVDGLRAAGLPA